MNYFILEEIRFTFLRWEFSCSFSNASLQRCSQWFSDKRKRAHIRKLIDVNFCVANTAVRIVDPCVPSLNGPFQRFPWHSHVNEISNTLSFVSNGKSKTIELNRKQKQLTTPKCEDSINNGLIVQQNVDDHNCSTFNFASKLMMK